MVGNLLAIADAAIVAGLGAAGYRLASRAKFSVAVIHSSDTDGSFQQQESAMQIEIIIFIFIGCQVAMVIGLNAVAYYHFKPLFREMDANPKYVAELGARTDELIAENWIRIEQIDRQLAGNKLCSVRIDELTGEVASTRRELIAAVSHHVHHTDGSISFRAPLPETP